MAKTSPEGTQRVQIVQQTGREDRIRETAIRLFASRLDLSADAAVQARQVIEAAVAFENTWREMKDADALEPPRPDDDVFTT